MFDITKKSSENISFPHLELFYLFKIVLLQGAEGCESHLSPIFFLFYTVLGGNWLKYEVGLPLFGLVSPSWKILDLSLPANGSTILVKTNFANKNEFQ